MLLTKEELKKMTLRQLGELIRKECSDVGQYGEEYLASLLNTPSEEQEDSKLRLTERGTQQAQSMALNSGMYRSENSQNVKKELMRRAQAGIKRHYG